MSRGRSEVYNNADDLKAAFIVTWAYLQPQQWQNNNVGLLIVKTKEMIIKFVGNQQEVYNHLNIYGSHVESLKYLAVDITKHLT